MRHTTFTLLLAVLWTIAAQSQKQASCTFAFFGFTRTEYINEPTGINDWGTVVGVSGDMGFVRDVKGGFTYYTIPNATSTSLADRNNEGTSVGSYITSGVFQKGFVLNKSRSSFISIVHPKSLSGTHGTSIGRINKWNSIVGSYWDAQNVAHGFKRYSNGGFLALDFPRGQGTFLLGINDNGMIVGSSGAGHGVIYYNGKWARLDYPNAQITTLTGISNSGMIVGTAQLPSQTSPIAFLYRSGVFEIVSVPNVRETEVTAISLKKGLITGVTRDLNGKPQGFVAKCN